MIFAYDKITGVLSKYKRGFSFEHVVKDNLDGLQVCDGKGNVETLVPEQACFFGSSFLSGFLSNRFLCIHSNGITATVALLEVRGKNIVTSFMPKIPRQVHHTVPVCLSGPVCSDPFAVSAYARMYPCNKFFACPIVEELPSFGALVYGIKQWGKVRSGKECFQQPCIDELDLPGKRLDSTIENDFFGKMAFHVSRLGIPVLNQVMLPIGISPFYGRLVHKDWKEFKDPVCLVTAEEVDSSFVEPISLKGYASMSVPVRMTCTDHFKEEWDWPEDEATVFVGSSIQNGVNTFLGFYNRLEGKQVVFSFDAKCLGSAKSLSLFRYNKAYRVRSEQLMEMGVV